MIINQSNLSILNQAFNGAFKGAMQAAKPLWADVAMRVPSSTGEEKYGWLGSTTRFREWLGDRQYQNLKIHDYTIKNKTFENTVRVPRPDIEDDQYGVYTPLMSQMGMDAAMFPDELVFGLIKNGGATLCYDGQNFFDTDHPVGGVGGETPASVSNFSSGGGTAWYLLDTSKVVRPIIFQERRPFRLTAKTSLTDDSVFERDEFVWGSDGRCNAGYGLWQLAFKSTQTLDETNYAAARAAMTAYRSDAGKPLNVMPTVLLVPPSLEFAALKLVQAEMNAAGASNVFRNTARVVVTPWII